MASPALATEQIERHLDSLCSIGNRYVGSAGEAAARDYVLTHFRDAGLNAVRAEEIRVRTYEGHAATCRLTDPPLSLPCLGLQGTVSGEVAADAVYLGGGESVAEVLGETPPPLCGRIAVFQSFWPWELTDVLLELGVVGIVVISDVPEDLIAHLPARWYGLDEPAPVPGVTVGARTGRQLVQALANGASRVRIGHEARYPTTMTSNLLADIPGRNPTNTRVLLAAHYDTFRIGQGAHDNATGLASLLAAATSWSSHPAEQTITLASFAAEELGLCGSTEYCRHHAADLHQIKAMINLDALAWTVAGRRALVVDPNLQEEAVEILTQLNWAPDTIEDARLVASDITPFVRAGVPGAWCWRFPPQHPYFGTERDSREFIDVPLLADTANAACGLAYRLAS